MVTVVPRVFKSPITSFEANCACQTWITPTVEMMMVLTITKALEEFIQEVEAVSPFMRDYSHPIWLSATEGGEGMELGRPSH